MIKETFRRLFAMMRPRERMQFYLLLGLITVSGLADMVGVAAILPFLSVLADPAAVDKNAFLGWLYEITAPADIDAFLFILGAGVFAIIVLGTAIKVFTMYALARFSNMRKYHIGQRLLLGYLRQPYVFFLRRHSSDMVKTVIQEVDQMIGSAMMPAMRVVAQSVSTAFLVILLLVVEPLIALIVLGVLTVVYGGIFIFVRRRLSQLGQDRIATNRARNRIAGEALGGVKDVKLMGLEEAYIQRFRNPARRHAQVLISIQVIGELPRYALEALTFGGMVALILFLLGRSDVGMAEAGVSPLADVIPILGLFAIAGLRMLPAIQGIYHSMSMLRTGQAVLREVSRDLAMVEASASGGVPGRPETDARQAIAFADTLELRDAVYIYPGTMRRVLDGLSLTVSARTTVGVVGGSGAGKTTAIDVILGLLSLDEGGLHVDGEKIEGARVRAWQDRIGYVPQQIFLIDDTVTSNIAFGVPKDKIDHAAVERAAKMARLHDFILSDLEQGYNTPVGERGMRLSGGQRQRIGIARALYHDPDVLVFDEATSALDTLTEAAIMEAVAGLAHAKTIIMIAHRLTTVRACDRIFLLEHGKVADQGTYDDLVARNPTFAKMAHGSSQGPRHVAPEDQSQG